MLGLMFLLETFFMLACTGVAFFDKGDDFIPFLLSTGILFGSGLLFYLVGFRANEYAAGRREGMLTVALTWVFFSLFGMLPYYFGGYIETISDAFFETMSGFTTTGASVFSDIESLPNSILLWRSLSQWQGGIGIIVFTVALMPIFGGGATQLFDAEIPSITHERFKPRIAQVAKRISGVYVFLTILLAGLLWAGPMSLFDAINHALTTISTGGCSTKNASIAYFQSAYVEYMIMIFMFIGSTNMTLIYFCFNRQGKKLLNDEEFRWFFSFILLTSVLVTIWLLVNGMETGIEQSFRSAAFNVVSLISSTGFMTVDYLAWGPFFGWIAIILMVICGCAGSTSGGLKMGRVVILSKNLSNEFMKQTHPRAVIPVRMNGHVVSNDIVHRVLAFAFAYITLIVVSILVLAASGMAFEESIGAVVTSLGNVGPGLGELGPAGNFSEVPAGIKWFLSFLMLTGRLEVFTVLTILLPGFWKQ